MLENFYQAAERCTIQKDEWHNSPSAVQQILRSEQECVKVKNDTRNDENKWIEQQSKDGKLKMTSNSAIH